jgi:hypothetical protein
MIGVMGANWMEQNRYFGYNLRQQISRFGPVAQLAEQATLNRLVGRSIRPGVTARINTEAHTWTVVGFTYFLAKPVLTAIDNQRSKHPWHPPRQGQDGDEQDRTTALIDHRQWRKKQTHQNTHARHGTSSL